MNDLLIVFSQETDKDLINEIQFLILDIYNSLKPYKIYL